MADVALTTGIAVTTIPHTYHLGAVVRASELFTYTTGVAVDPTEVYFQYQRPASAVVVTLHYGVDLNLIRDGVGQYHVDMNADTEGQWTYQFRSTGAGESCYEHSFYVVAGEV